MNYKSNDTLMQKTLFWIIALKNHLVSQKYNENNGSNWLNFFLDKYEDFGVLPDFIIDSPHSNFNIFRQIEFYLKFAQHEYQRDFRQVLALKDIQTFKLIEFKKGAESVGTFNFPVPKSVKPSDCFRNFNLEYDVFEVYWYPPDADEEIFVKRYIKLMESITQAKNLLKEQYIPDIEALHFKELKMVLIALRPTPPFKYLAELKSELQTYEKDLYKEIEAPKTYTPTIVHKFLERLRSDQSYQINHEDELIMKFRYFSQYRSVYFKKNFGTKWKLFYDEMRKERILSYAEIFKKIGCENSHNSFKTMLINSFEHTFYNLPNKEKEKYKNFQLRHNKIKEIFSFEKK